MPEPPRHKPFQIHLSTAIVLMLATGIFIWVNSTDRNNSIGDQSISFAGIDITQRKASYLTQVFRVYGWPARAILRIDTILLKEAGKTSVKPGYIVYYPFVVVDIFVILINLFTLWFLCEWLIRRRAASY